MNKNNHENAPYSDDEFTVVDLDTEDHDQQSRTPAPVIERRLSPWIRRGMASLTIVGSIALCALLWPYLQQAFFHNQSVAKPVPPGTSYEISLDLALSNDIIGIYANSPKGSSLDGLRNSNGSRLWRYNSTVIGKPINVQGVLYVATSTSVDALQLRSGKVLWRRQTTSDVQELRVADGIVYIHTILPKNDLEPGSPEIVVALRASDGQMLWQYTTRGFNQSLQVKDGIVYIYATGGQQALRARDGTLLWQHENGIYVPLPPYIGNGVAYVYSTHQYGPDSNALLWSIDAVRASDGKLLWQHSANGIIIHIENGIVYIYRQQDERIEAVHESDGKSLWNYQMSKGDQPLFDQGVVYVYTQDGPAALRASDGTLLWQSKVSVDTLRLENNRLYSYSPQGESVVALNSSNGELIWQHQAPADSTLTVANGQVYIRRTLAGAALEALRGSDGALLWQQKTNGDVLQVQNNQVYVNSQADGTLDALSTRDGKLIWHYQAPHH